jgi:hypothetical protein
MEISNTSSNMLLCFYFENNTPTLAIMKDLTEPNNSQINQLRLEMRHQIPRPSSVIGPVFFFAGFVI